MKKLIINCLATTALTLLTLATIAFLHNAKFLFISSVFQTFFANATIHLGLVLVRKFECKYFFFELLLEIGYTLTVLIIYGAIFDWYGSTPLLTVIIMGVLVYLIGFVFGITKVSHDLELINKELKKRVEMQNIDRSDVI